MAIEVMELVRKASLERGTKIVLLAMANYASKNGSNVFPGTARLARDTAYSPRWIYEKRRGLIAMGLLVQTRPSTPVSPGHYRIVLEAVQELIEGVELDSPVEAASPPEASEPGPLNSVPRPPEVTSPNPSVEPLVEPSGGAEHEMEQEVEKRYQQAIDRGTPISNPEGYKRKILENIKPQHEAKARENLVVDAMRAEIEACSICNDDGNAAWETKDGHAPRSERCTHLRADYSEFTLIK
jgi:hypothetical protein